MNRFRIRDNVPDTYVKRSRDFQLLCDLFDIVNNGVKFDIDSIMDLSNTELTRESMLPYLQSKLGLVTSKQLPQDTLRTLLKCFPYLIKKKGSREGIIAAIYLFLNVIHTDCNYSAEIYNNSNSSVNGNYVVVISLQHNVLKNLHILDDLLKYVLPTGYILNYKLAYELADLKTYVAPKDEIRVTLLNEHFGSHARPKYSQTEGDGSTVVSYESLIADGEGSSRPFSSVAGAVGTTIITSYAEPYSKNTDLVDWRTTNFIENVVEESEVNT